MFILDTAEVWAILIPLAVWYKRPTQPKWMTPLILYLIFAFCNNLIVEVMAELQERTPVDSDKQSSFNNLFLYNLHSIWRFFTLLATCWYMNMLAHRWLKVIAAIFIAAMLLHPFFGVPLVFPGPDQMKSFPMNANLMTLEAFLLLIPCMAFYLKLINSETTGYLNRKDFWAVTGITIYLVSIFFYFLFYTQLFAENQKSVGDLWGFHNIAYIVFFIFIAIALYLPDGDNY